MKPLFKFSLFLFIFFLLGCTITKRKYTGGYYVNWHSNKAPIAKTCTETASASNNQNQTTTFVSNKTAKSSDRNYALNYLRSEKAGTNKLLKPMKQVQRGQVQHKVLNYPAFTTIPKNTIQEHNISKNDTSKWNLRLCWLFCLLEFISILAIILINYINPLQIFFIILALLSFILSLVFGILARKDGHKMGLNLVLISNIVFVIIIIIAGIIGVSENGI